MKLSVLANVERFALPRFSREDGDLVVIETGNSIQYAVARTFLVHTTAGAVRGRHAHKACHQFFVCVQGAIDVVCDDGTQKATYLLDASDQGLWVPPGIWATETSKVGPSVLLVLCDLPYDAQDYIRDYESFLTWRRQHA